MICPHCGKETNEVGGLSVKEVQQANAKVDAMIANARQQKYINRDKMPEAYLDLCDAYVEMTGQEPRKPVLQDWMMTFSEMQATGITVEHERSAYEKLSKSGILVTRPGSLLSTAFAIKGKASVSFDLRRALILESIKKFVGNED